MGGSGVAVGVGLGVGDGEGVGVGVGIGVGVDVRVGVCVGSGVGVETGLGAATDRGNAALGSGLSGSGGSDLEHESANATTAAANNREMALFRGNERATAPQQIAYIKRPLVAGTGSC